jgi:phage/plasmid-associated DNA primase
MFHASQGLYSGHKEGVMLLWTGGGQNGKTCFLRWVAKALGPYADKFNIQLMSSAREDADKPNSAIMRFKHVNWAYCEESDRIQKLNVPRMKELVNAGEISGRDLHQQQETFTVKTNITAASQYQFIVETTDHGTWRRLKCYTSKTKFCAKPDPNNPYEKQDDQRFILKFTTDPHFLSAVLSVLSHYYERLQYEYGGELKNVYSETIERETEIFRLSQDTVHRWICESVVKSPGCDVEYNMANITTSYSDWYRVNIGHNTSHITANSLSKDLAASALSAYLITGPNKAMLLRGCRILASNEPALREGEAYFYIQKRL